VQPNFGEMPPNLPELTNNIGSLNYWSTMVAELMRQIPQVHVETPPKNDKLANRVARHNPKVYEGKYDPVQLEEWVRGKGNSKNFFSVTSSIRKESKHWDPLFDW